MTTDFSKVEAELTSQIKAAKLSTASLISLSEIQRNSALELIERELLESSNYILEANQEDLNSPDNADLTTALKDRLRLDHKRLIGMAQAIRKVINIPDPISRVIEGWRHPKGMKISKVSVPIGVIGIIYEARPNVTTDAIALAIKSANACVLRGSRQTWHTNNAIMDVVYRALKQSDFPIEAVQYLKDKSRDSAKLMLRAKDEINLVIPRGGEALKKFVTENSLIPVLGAGGGNCHVYIDAEADIDKAVEIILNAKTQRPSVCNACESILIHADIKDEVLPFLVQELLKSGVEIVADQDIHVLYPFTTLVTEADWGLEYLDLKVSIKTVESLDAAIQHINFYSNNHSEAIITENINAAEKFTRMVNSACVYVNASTRFTDGEEFGFGAEMGISTSIGYVRGPIGAKELCTYKYIIEGNGQIR
jgi:glutamate-5-semialdehyde dehydrogenase